MKPSVAKIITKRAFAQRLKLNMKIASSKPSVQLNVMKSSTLAFHSEAEQFKTDLRNFAWGQLFLCTGITF